MKRVFLTLIMLICLGYISYAQSWEPVGTGIDLYDSSSDSPIHVLYPYHGKLYIGGTFTHSGKKKINSLACWDDKKIDTVDGVISPDVLALVEYKGNLCIGGDFRKKMIHNTVASNIILWRDSLNIWTRLGAGVERCNICDGQKEVYALSIYKGELYAGGAFKKAGDYAANCIAKWNGNSWDTLADHDGTKGGQAKIYGVVRALCVYMDKLYIGGEFYNTDGSNRNGILCWDGTKFDKSLIGINKGNGLQVDGYIHDYKINALCVYNGFLYAAGGFDSIGGKRIINIAQWNGASWVSVGGGLKYSISALAVYNDKLYVGGDFDSAGGKPALNIAAWDGASWSAVGDGLETTPKHYFKGRVTSLAVYKNELYAGGIFSYSGSTKLNNLAKLGLKVNMPKQKKKTR